MIRPVIRSIISEIGLGIWIGKHRGSSYWTQRLYDSGYGPTINTSKWVVTNPDPTVATFEQGNAINMHSLFVNNADPYANNIKSVKSQSSGYWIFSYLDMLAFNGAGVVEYAGLMDSTFQNGIEFYKATSAYSSFRIIQNGAAVYAFNGLPSKDLNTFKISIDSNHVIKVYGWVNDAWVQIGVTKTYDLGSLAVFMSSAGATIAGLGGVISSLSDVYIYDNDDKPNDVPSFNQGIDPRQFGAVPDGVTDCSYAINLALTMGDVCLKYGIFLTTSAIIIPSNRNLYIHNARHYKADDSYDSFYRNSNFEGGNTNISIIGRGCAILDGNTANNTDATYAIYGPIGYPIAENTNKYFSLFLCNVSNFEVSGLVMQDHPQWSVFLQKATGGIVKNIYFNNLRLKSNGDGIDILWGCNNIDFTNIRGYTQDDSIAISDADQVSIGYPITDYNTFQIHDITFTDIYWYDSGRYTLFTGGGQGKPIYNISFENLKVHNTNYLVENNLEVSVVDPPAKTDLIDWTFNNIQVDGSLSTHLIDIVANCMNFVFTNFVNNSGKSPIAISASDFENISINGNLYPVPTLVIKTVENADPNKIILTYDLELDETSVPATTDFTISGGKTVTNVAIDGTAKTVTLTASANYVSTDTITASYTPGTNPIRGYEDNNSDSFTNVAVTNNVAAAFPSTGLLAKWDVLGNANDSTVNGYHLTNNNGVLCPDRLSRADSAYDLVPASSAWLTRNPFTEIHLQEFTVAKWFKADALTNLDVIVGDINIASYAEGWGIIYISSGTKLRFFLNSWNTNYVELTFNDTAGWHCVIVSYKQAAVTNNVKISIDGGSEVIGSYAGLLTWGSCVFEMGQRNGPAYFDGKHGPCYLWNVELNSQDKVSVYNYYL